jgi:hypothetical protein
LTKRLKFVTVFCNLLSASHLMHDELHWAREKIKLGFILISRFVCRMFIFLLVRHFRVTAWISQGALQISLEISRRRSRLKFDTILALVLHCFTWILSLIFLVIESMSFLSNGRNWIRNVILHIVLVKGSLNVSL